MERNLGVSGSLLAGLAARAQLTDCPLRAFQVKVTRCSGVGECTAVCMVNVFETGPSGKCTVINEDLCFGCMACVAQCADGGVSVSYREARRFPQAEDLLR